MKLRKVKTKLKLKKLIVIIYHNNQSIKFFKLTNALPFIQVNKHYTTLFPIMNSY